MFGDFGHGGGVGVPASDFLRWERPRAFDVGCGKGRSSKVEHIDGRVDGDEGSVVRCGDPSTQSLVLRMHILGRWDTSDRVDQSRLLDHFLENGRRQNYARLRGRQHLCARRTTC